MIAAQSISVAEESVTEETIRSGQVVLQVAVVTNAPNTTLAFTARNNGKTELRTSTFVGTWNRIVITDPDGKMMEVYDRVMEIEPTIIKPSESKIWKVGIASILQTLNLEKPGTYKLHWKLRDITTDDPTFKYKSNEVLLFREEKA